MMSKIYQLIILVVSVLVTSSIHAQKIGIRAGVNMSNMKITNNHPIMGANPNNKIGAHFEMMVDYALNSNLSIESALGISTKGYRVTVDQYKPISGLKYTTTGLRSMNYLDIPVRLKLQTSNTRNKYFASLGPQVGIGLTGKWHTEKIISERSTIEGKQVGWNDANDVNSFKRLDFGYMVGVGIEMNTLIIECTYSASFGNISATNELGNLAKNQVFSLSVGRYLLRRVRNTTEKELMRSSHFEIIKRTKRYPKKSTKKKRRRH